MGFNFVRAAVACAILERISGLEPLSETTAPRYLKLAKVSSFCPFYLYLSLDVIGAVCYQFYLLDTDLHLMLCVLILSFFMETPKPACQTVSRLFLNP